MSEEKSRDTREEEDEGEDHELLVHILRHRGGVLQGAPTGEPFAESNRRRCEVPPPIAAAEADLLNKTRLKTAGHSEEPRNSHASADVSRTTNGKSATTTSTVAEFFSK